MGGQLRTSPLFIITHGEPASSLALSEALKDAGRTSAIPFAGQEIELEPNGSASVHRVTPQPIVLVKEEVSGILTDIQSLALKLENNSVSSGLDSLVPLLKSSKILLETAYDRMTGSRSAD